MRTDQSELGGCVIEMREIVPLFCGVAGFATCRLSAGCYALHSLMELATMGVAVTRSTRQVREVIGNDLGFRSGFVAIHAGDCHMSSGKDERTLLVPREGKCRSVETLLAVAFFTSI